MSEILSSAPVPFFPDSLTIPQFILDAAHPDRPVRPSSVPWMIDEVSGKSIALEELRMRTYGLANELKARYQIGENDVVCIVSPNDLDFPVVMWAVHRLGGIVTTSNPAYTVDELVHQLEVTKATLIFSHTVALPTVNAASQKCGLSSQRTVVFGAGCDAHKSAYSTMNEMVVAGLSKESCFVERRLNPGEAKTKLALLMMSSGTTGKPKAVALSHYSFTCNVIQLSSHLHATDPKNARYQPGDVCYAVAPFFHIYSLIVILHMHIFIGFSVVVAPSFSFEGMLKSIETYRITHLMLVPPMCLLISKHPAAKKYNLSSVKVCISGAAPLSVDLIKQTEVALPGAVIGQGYGATETGVVVSSQRFGDRDIGTSGSVGYLLPGIKARVIKPDGTLAGFGEPGELVVTGPSMALYYLGDEQATKDTFLNGWVRTGDEVVVNKEGEIVIVDRLKELIKVKGLQVAPAELEGHLLAHPDVADTCVVSIPDEYKGEVPFAFVVPSAAALARIKKSAKEDAVIKKALFQHVASAKAQHKWLEGGIEFIDVIPKSPSGKILRRVLRDQIRARVASKTVVHAKL